MSWVWSQEKNTAHKLNFYLNIHYYKFFYDMVIKINFGCQHVHAYTERTGDSIKLIYSEKHTLH